MKRILTIISIILLTASYSHAQDNKGPLPDGAGKFLKLYPNPATSYITFDLDKNFQKGLTLSVFSFLGKKMIETPNLSEKTTVTLNDFNRGMYIYHITDPTGKVIDSGKFQVSR